MYTFFIWAINASATSIQCVNQMFNKIQNRPIFLKRFQRPSNYAYRQHTFIVTSLKTEKRRPLTLRRKENYRPI